MGQPMGSSYENRWLSAGDDNKKASSLPGGRRKSITSEDGHKPAVNNKENAKKKENTRPQNGEAPKKAQKDMTKAERRAIQEKQRLEKQTRVAAGLPKSSKQAAELEAKKGPAASTSGAPQSDADVNKQNKKKALSKNQQNQVPWLLHLDAPKTSDALTKDLHPAVLQLGLYFSNHKIVGSNARCVAMLEIFSKVI